MAFNKIWVSHAKYTATRVLNGRIKKYPVHMNLQVPVALLPTSDICDAIKALTTKDKEMSEKASVIAVFTVGPKWWHVKISMPKYLHMTEAYIDSDPLQSMMYGSQIYRVPDKVVSKGWCLDEKAGLELLNTTSANGDISFNAAATRLKEYRMV
jgi:hypothetical protein